MPQLILNQPRSTFPRPPVYNNPCDCGQTHEVVKSPPPAPPQTTGFGLSAGLDIKSMVLGALVGALIVYAFLKLR